MNILSYKTISANQQTIDKAWLLIDAKGQHLGRLASQIAYLLRGKDKPYFTPHVDCGANIIVIHADGICLTGKKWDGKSYISHTGYPGGQRTITPRLLKEKFPTRILEHAVKGMLPKSKLGDRLFFNLFIYTGASHPHEAQRPKEVTLNY